MGSGMVIREEDHSRLTGLLERLVAESSAKFSFLIDRAGQRIASGGDLGEVDPTALASLVAGNVAATEGVAQLVGETSFASLFHEGQKESLHISSAGPSILLVVFDERSSLGLVRLRVQQLTAPISDAIQLIEDRGETVASSGVAGIGIAEITEADIDALFG